MKLRAYTPEETDDLIDSIKFIASNSVDINTRAVQILKLKYMEYLSSFRVTLFKWTALDFDEFVKTLYCHGSYVREKAKLYPNTFELDFYKTPFKYYRNTNFQPIFYEHVLEKYDIPVLTNYEKDLLLLAKHLTDYVVLHFKLHDKYRTLINYAKKPFEFEEDDISWIESVKLSKKKIEDFYELHID